MRKVVKYFPSSRLDYTELELEGVEMSDQLITEQTGYISVKDMIERMAHSGAVLDDYRHEVYGNDIDPSENQIAISIYEQDPVDYARYAQLLEESRRIRDEEMDKDDSAETPAEESSADGDKVSDTPPKVQPKDVPEEKK